MHEKKELHLRARSMAQAVEHLSSKSKALSSNTSIAKQKKKKKKKRIILFKTTSTLKEPKSYCLFKTANSHSPDLIPTLLKLSESQEQPYRERKYVLRGKCY
jgi:ABC-type oligopeptide transport system ATPase subunit